MLDRFLILFRENTLIILNTRNTYLKQYSLCTTEDDPFFFFFRPNRDDPFLIQEIFKILNYLFRFLLDSSLLLLSTQQLFLSLTFCISSTFKHQQPFISLTLSYLLLLNTQQLPLSLLKHFKISIHFKILCCLQKESSFLGRRVLEWNKAPSQ